MINNDLDKLGDSGGFTTFGGAIKEFGAGIGLSVVKGVEGVFELGNIIPGIDYDLKLVEEVKDVFDYKESDSFAEQFGEFVGFAATLATGAGAVGEGLNVAGKVAKGSKLLRGYTETRAAQAAVALSLKHPKLAANLATNAKFAMADFLMTSGDDAFDLVSMLGLDDSAIVEHFAIQEGESELSKRLKGALQGFAVGVPVDFAFEKAIVAGKKGIESVSQGVEKLGTLNKELGNAGIIINPFSSFDHEGEKRINDKLFNDLWDTLNPGLTKEQQANLQNLQNIINQPPILQIDRSPAELTVIDQLIDKEVLGTPLTTSEEAYMKVIDFENSQAGLDLADNITRNYAGARITDMKIQAASKVGDRQAEVAGRQIQEEYFDSLRKQVREGVDPALAGPQDLGHISYAKITQMEFGALKDAASGILNPAETKGLSRNELERMFYDAQIAEKIYSINYHMKEAIPNLDVKLVGAMDKEGISDVTKALFSDMFAAPKELVDNLKAEAVKAAKERMEKILPTKATPSTSGVDPIAPLSPLDRPPETGFDRPQMTFRGEGIPKSVEGAGSKMSPDKLRDLAELIDVNERTPVIDLAHSAKGMSPTVVVAQADMIRIVKEQIKERETSLIQGGLDTQTASRLRKELTELERINVKMDAKVPGLFKGDAKPKEHLAVLDKLEKEVNVPSLTKTEAEVRFQALKGLKEGTKDFDTLAEAAHQLGKDASPSDRLSITELLAYRKSSGKVQDFNVIQGHMVLSLGESLENDLVKFAKDTARSYKADYEKVYIAYANHLNELAVNLKDTLEKEITGSFTKEKKLLIMTQYLDQLESMREGIRGITRPSSIHAKRNLSNLSKAELDKMSPQRINKELSRIGADRRYNIDAIEQVVKTVNDLIPGDTTVSVVEMLDSVARNGFSFVGASSKVAELNVAVIMASTKLLTSNVIQNVIKIKTDKLSEWLGRKLLGKGATKIPVVNEVTINKSLLGIKMFGRLTKASSEGQARSGLGAILSDITSSVEVKPNVSAFKVEGRAARARNIGFEVAGASDDGAKAMVLIMDTLDTISRSEGLTTEQFNLVQDALPGIVETRLKLGEKITAKDLASDVNRTIDISTTGADIKSKEAYATLKSEVEGSIVTAFDKAKEATFTGYKSVEQIAEEHGPHMAAIAGVVRGVAEGSEKIPFAGPIIRTISQPFVNTPLNAALYGSSLTPLSKSWWKGTFLPIAAKYPEALPKLTKLLGGVENLTVDKLKDNPELISAIGKAWIGNTIAATTVLVAGTGIISVTGRGPSNPQDRTVWMEQGNKPYSIRFPGTDYILGLNRLGPIALPFIVGAELHDAFTNNPWDDEGISENIKGLMAGGIELYLGMSSLDSSAKLLDAIVNQNESAISQIVAGLAIPSAGVLTGLSSAAPLLSSLGSLASEFSTSEGTVLGAGFLAKTGQKIQNRYLRFTGDGRRNIYGEEIDTSLMQAGLNIALPIATFTTIKDTPLNIEMNKLDMPISKMRSVMSGLNLLDEKYAIGDQSAYDRLQQHLGTTQLRGMNLQQALTKLIRSSRYRKLSEVGIPEQGIASPRVNEVKRLFATYQAAAKEQLLKESRPLKSDLRNVEVGRRALSSGKSADSIVASLFKI